MARPVYHSSTSAVGSAVTSKTFSHTVPNVNNRLLIVAVSHPGNTNVNGVTWNGSALTRLDRIAYGFSSTEPYFQIWYKIAPAVGTYNIQVSMVAAFVSDVQLIANAANFYEVDQTNPFVDYEKYALIGGTNNLNILSHGMAYGGIATTGGTANVSQSVYQKSTWEETSDTNWVGAGARRGGAGNSDLIFTTTNPIAGIVVSLRGSSPAYSAPVFDRAQTDIDNRTAKGFFNLADWDRIFENSSIATDLVNTNEGTSLVFDYVGYPRMRDSAQKALLNRLITNVRQCVEVVAPGIYTGGFQRMRVWGDGNVNSPKFTDINAIEENLSLIFDLYSYP